MDIILSEDEIDIEEEIELDQYGMPIEQEDDDEMEMRRIISEKILNRISSNNLLDYSNNKDSPVNIKKEPKKNKNLSLNDLNKLIDIKIEESKPKKFVSKRVLEKKNLSDPVLKKEVYINKRVFNPRKLPYLLSNEYKNKFNKQEDIFTEKNLPKL
jgi:hypothetical protein